VAGRARLSGEGVTQDQAFKLDQDGKITRGKTVWNGATVSDADMKT
jgi:hypothetical protein